MWFSGLLSHCCCTVMGEAHQSKSLQPESIWLQHAVLLVAWSRMICGARILLASQNLGNLVRIICPEVTVVIWKGPEPIQRGGAALIRAWLTFCKPAVLLPCTRLAVLAGRYRPQTWSG